MAVTFGRLGTTTLNRGVNLTVTSEFKISAGGIDVQPDAVNWRDITYNGITGEFKSTTQRITGITTSIMLKVVIAGDGAALAYAINSGLTDGEIILNPGLYGFSYIASGDSFSVSNDQDVSFCVDPGLGTIANFSANVAIQNASNSDQQLDKFNTTAFNIP